MPTDPVVSDRTQAPHVAAARQVADASAPAKPISSGIFGAVPPSEIVKRVEREIFVADATMTQMFKYYDYNAGRKPPDEMIVAATANEEEQFLLQQMADELKVRIRSLEAEPKGTVAGLKELKDEYDRLQRRVQGSGGSRPTGLELAREILVDLDGHATRSEHAMIRVELRAHADSEFGWAVHSGDSNKIPAYKQLLLEQAHEAVKAWQAAVDHAKKGAKPEVIKNFNDNLDAAKAKLKQIEDPKYGMGS